MPDKNYRLRLPTKWWVVVGLAVVLAVAILILMQADDNETAKQSGLDEFCRLAADRAEHGDTAGAEHYYRLALTENPTYPQACVPMAQIAFSAKKYNHTVMFGRRALESEPGNHLAAYYLGLAFDRLQYPDSATAYLQRAIELEPTFARGHYSLGMLWLNRQEPDSAIKYLNSYLENHPASSQSVQEVRQLIDALEAER